MQSGKAVSVYGIMCDLGYLIFFCTVFVGVILYLCLLLLGLIPWAIFATVYGRLTGVNLVSFTVTRNQLKINWDFQVEVV